MNQLQALRTSNVRTSWLARGTKLAVPATFSVLALAGVTVRPAIDIGQARTALALAEQRCDEARVERELHAQHLRGHTLERLNSALAAIDAKVPRELSQVVAHSLLRRAAQQCDIELTRLDAAGDRDLGLAASSDRIVALTLGVGGRATLVELENLLDALRSGGAPACVFEVTLRRSDPRDPRFEFQLVLGLLHRAPLDAGGGTIEAGEQP